jgi:signal transduction histidine kinase
MKITKYFYLEMSVALPILTLLISLLITYQALHVAQDEVKQKAQIYFDFRVREANNLINQRMKVYEQALRGTAGLFKASNTVERNDFKQYVASLNLAKNYAGIQGVGFSLIVPPAKKAQHIASIRSEGFPTYTIKPDGQRDIYTSIIYLEPFSDRNLRAFGYDMFSHPVRHAAMQKAIDSGEATLSGEVKLIQETGKQEQSGFLMYLPIYRNGTNNETVSERREHALGWVYLPFRMNDLMNGLFGEHAADLHIRIFDGKSMSNAALMYDSKGSNLTPKMSISKTLEVQIANHPWTIDIHSLLPLGSRIGINYPKLVAVVGPIVSILLSLLIWFLMTSRKLTRKLNIQNDEKDKRSADLAIANKELNEIEHSLLISKSEAEKANQDKSKFLAAASHDLRQPLSALSLYVDVLTKQNNSDDSGLGKKIQECVSSLSELLDNLLNVSKLDAGVVVATKTTFRVSDLLGSLVNIHAAEAALKGISLHVRCTNLITHTDQTILQRILGNLIANAIRYTDKGGVLIGCRRHNGKQWIEVWDSGVGFPSNMAKHIFEEFTQLGDNSRSVGSGLGLAIAGKSAKLLGLELRVHSRPGRGSMFAIEIPQGNASLIETPSEPKALVNKCLIALVDDNPMVLDATSFALTAIGHQVVAGESELDLLKNIGDQEPDILISDYRLADNKTGLDLILKARRVLGEDLPAILITGDTDPKLIKLFAKHKIKVCYKPLKIDVLNDLIRTVMLKS